MREGNGASPVGTSRIVRRPTFWDACLLVFLVFMIFMIPDRLAGVSGDAGAGQYLEIRSIDGLSTVFLKENAEYVVNGPLGPEKLIVEDGRARMESAPCPLKICEAMGPIDDPGETILCLPNRISVKVKGSGGLDAVSR